MAIDLLAQSSVASSFLSKVAFSLRYEITFVIAMIVLWGMGKLASRQKPSRSPKVASPRNSTKAHSPRGMKTPSPGSMKDGSPKGDTADSSFVPLSQPGNLDEINPALLRNPSWLVPQVTHLSRTQVQNALSLYRAAVKAGLQLQDVPAKDCEQLFAALVTATIRTGQMGDAMQLLRDLRKRGLGVCTSLFSSVVKLCTSKHLFGECLLVYDFVAEDPDFELADKSIWSCLLFCAIETRSYQRCGFFFERLKASGLPSNKDYGNMVRLASLQGDWQLSLQVIQDMRAAGVDMESVVYNTALATCIGASHVDEARELLAEMECKEGLADVITYNTLMKGYAKAGRMSECFEIFERLKLRKVAPSQVTYGILLDGFINENQLDRAAEVFAKMSSESFAMNTVLFTTLIKGFARAGDVDQAMKVYDQMCKDSSIKPDLITFSILIKANCDSNRLEQALQLLEGMVNLNLRPDEVVFNNLLTGCARQANAVLGKRLYADMIASGIRPSNATFSILIRFFHQCKMLEDAVEMLRHEPAKHKVDPEQRLFLQLIQSCIRERQGRRAVEAYEMLVEHSVPNASTHSSILTTCGKLNMFDTAAEILTIAAKKGGRVGSQDAMALLEGAMRKKKTQVAHDIAAAMEKLGLSPQQ